MLGRTNLREQIGYITVGLLAHCMIDRNKKCEQIVLDSLRTILDPTYVGHTAWKDLAFQRYQEYDCLTRTLEQEKMTIPELIVAIELRKAQEFFSKLAHQAILDTEYRTCQVSPGVRTFLVKNG